MRAVKRLGLFACLLLALSQPLRAQELPALYAVSGVKSSDRLNLREKPDPRSAIVGSLAPDAEDVEVVGLSRDGSWAQVNADDRSAWVALRFLTRQDGPPWWDAGVPLSCYGTEPFWGLKLDKGQALFDQPDGPEPAQAIGARWLREPLQPSGAGAVLGMRIGDGFAVIRSQSCSDGMSDRANGLMIDLFRTGAGDGQVYSGCCSLVR